MYLPNDLINLILEYENPYKTYFSKYVVSYFKNRYIYNILIKQLKQYCLYDTNNNVINFQIYAILYRRNI
jgi:hypothetical protein